MTMAEILLAILIGLAVNECCDVSPWVARKLVRWSAHRRYTPPSRAELRAEELAAYIDDRPGRLFKLITALGFVTAALVTRKIAPGVTRPIPLWQLTTPNVRVHYKESDSSGGSWAMHQPWCQLTKEVRKAAREAGVGSRSWRRCIKRLLRITGDERWAQMARNLDHLKEIKNSRPEPKWVSGGSVLGQQFAIYRYYIPTRETVERYQAAIEISCAEIRRLTSDFLLSSTPPSR